MAMNKRQEKDVEKLTELLKTYAKKMEKFRIELTELRKSPRNEFYHEQTSEIIAHSLSKSIPKFEKLAGTASEYLDHAGLSSLDTLELELSLLDFEMELQITQRLVEAY